MSELLNAEFGFEDGLLHVQQAFPVKESESEVQDGGEVSVGRPVQAVTQVSGIPGVRFSFVNGAPHVRVGGGVRVRGGGRVRDLGQDRACTQVPGLLGSARYVSLPAWVGPPYSQVSPPAWVGPPYTQASPPAFPVLRSSENRGEFISG